MNGWFEDEKKYTYMNGRRENREREITDGVRINKRIYDWMEVKIDRRIDELMEVR